MTKKPDIVDPVDEISFVANRSMQQTKAAFWCGAADTPMIDPTDLTLAAVQHLCKDTRIRRWWSLPGFKEWFSNKEEWRQRVEYLVNRGLDAVEDVLNDVEAAPSARVKAFEALARLAEKDPARVKEVRFADSQLNGMSREQLTAYIQRLGYKHIGSGEPTNEEESS